LTSDEVVDLVDESDEVVGQRTLGECLRLGLLHRAVAVLVQRSDGRFLLQQRSGKDSWQPGMWTLSTTGHVRSGEGFEEAAKRELEEELGIRAGLSMRGKLLLPSIAEGGLVERELVALFTSVTDDRCRIDKAEVEAVMEASPGDLREMMTNGPLTPDAKIILGEFFGGARRALTP
jgi:isopentenyldiphosphate isomerase